MGTCARLCLYSSFEEVTLIAWQLPDIGVLILLQFGLWTPAQLGSWGWRIPFVIGAGCAIVAMVLRRNMAETESFQRHRAPRDTSLLRELAKHPKALATVVGLTMGGTLAFYTYTTYMQQYLEIGRAHV